MCPEWAKLAEKYSQALNAYKMAATRLRDLKDREYVAAWRKTDILKKAHDTALQELQVHRRQHDC
jgi:hypothetical protein